MCFIFITTFGCDISHSKKISARYGHKSAQIFM